MRAQTPKPPRYKDLGAAVGALVESPFRDIAGYGLLGAARVEQKLARRG